MRGLRGVRAVRGVLLAIATGTLLTLSLSACTPAILISLGQGPGTTTGGHRTGTGTGTGTGTKAAPPIQHYSDGSRSERGNIPKVVGQKAGMLTPDGQTRLVTFTVTRIATDPHCLNQAAPAPTNGHYVEVDLQVVTTADLGIENSGTTVTFTPGNWFYYPPDKTGIIAGGVEAATPSDDCELSLPSLPDSIGPSMTVTGSVLLDVAPGSVFLAYAPGNACGCDTAWEWPYSG